MSMEEKNPPDPAVVRLMLIDHANCHALKVKRLRDVTLASEKEATILEELLTDMKEMTWMLEDYLSYLRA